MQSVCSHAETRAFRTNLWMQTCHYRRFHHGADGSPALACLFLGWVKPIKSAGQTLGPAVQWPINQVSTSDSMGFDSRWALG